MESHSFQKAGSYSGGENESSSPSPSSSAPIDQLPPEMLEKLFDYLGYDRNLLLKCRRINSFWKKVVDAYMERQILSNWTTWIPAMETRRFQAFPVLPLVPLGTHSGALLNFTYCPKGLTKKENPFPTKSLTISNLQEWKYLETNNDNVSWLKTDKFLSRLGHTLTSFVLHDTTLTPRQLDTIMENLTNLKALTLSLIKVQKSVPIGNVAEKKQNTSLIASNLTHFRAVNEVAPQIIQWMVLMTAHQLINLEVDASEIHLFQELCIFDLSKLQVVNPTPYQELKYLKIYGPSRPFLQSTVSFPLQYLSIVCFQEQENISLRTVVNFIDKFHTTLIHLHLDLRLNESLTLLAMQYPTEMDIIQLPNLVRFDFSCPDQITGAGVVLLKRYLLPKFPEIRHVQLLISTDNLGPPADEMFNIFEFVSYKQICPKLKTIQYGDRTVQA